MKFEEAYQQLNPAQRQAVDTLEGPLLVIAGPGTGKTQLLSMRVANILRQTDTDPRSILCLTFTNKAATNMRDRLLSLAGPTAHSVNTKTFHGFAADIMNQHPDYFWAGARLSIAPDAVQLEIVQDILSGLPLHNPLALKFAGNFTQIPDVQEALKLTKEAGLTPDKLRAIISHNIAFIDAIESSVVDILSPTLSFKRLASLAQAVNELPEHSIDQTIAPLVSLSTVLRESLAFAITQDEAIHKTTHAGQWKRRWVQTVDGKKGMFDERKRNDWWLAIADVYEQYRRALHERGYYDYADMLVEVITQLEAHPGLRAEVQEQYLYVLIDEFQDTNAAQLRLAHLVSDHHAANGKPNLMAVGDDDQSIYKFNGAELNNMLSFRRSYPDTRLIVLEENYRSSQAILDTAQRVIEQAEDRLVKREPDITKNLHAATPPTNTSNQLIEHRIYATKEHQLSGIARTIKQLRDEQPGSIAVLARGHRSLKQLAALLLAQQVPVRYEQQNNILEHEAVQQILLLAETLLAIARGDIEQVNYYLSQSLRHPMWNVAPELLWQLAVQNLAAPNWLESLQNVKSPSLSASANWLLWLAQEATYQPLGVIFEYLIGLRKTDDFCSPVQKYFVKRRTVSNDYLHALSAIRLLRSMVQEFIPGDQASLEDFVTFVRLNNDNQKIIADESAFVSGTNAVELLTVHKAKGLEYDTVVIIDTIEKNWQPSFRGRKPPANLPLRPNLDDFDDYARLMYVAVTRAKHSLITTSYATDEKGQELLTTPLLRSAIDVVRSEPVGSTPETITVLEESLRWPRLPVKNQKLLLSPRMERFTLSATALLNFLDVSRGGPEHFFQRHILRLPDVKTVALAHGNAMHSALEFAQKLVNTAGFNLVKVQTQYEHALTLEHLPVDEHQRYIEHGHKVLAALFTNLGYHLPVGSLAEQSITNVLVDAAQISGKLDRVDYDHGSTLQIVDYKTGTPLHSFYTKDAHKAIKAWRHKTQLIFYALLAQQSGRFAKAKNFETQMVYVEAESAKELQLHYTPTQDEINRLRALINACWQHIINLDMPDPTEYPPTIAGILRFENDLLHS